MSGEEARTRQELVAALRRNGEATAERLRAIPPARFAEGRYENGWSAREILAHIAAAEWAYPGMIAMARETAAQAAAGKRVELDAADPSGVVDDYNARQVARRADASIEELIDEFVANRAKTIAAVEGIDEALLPVRTRTVGTEAGPLAAVIHGLGVDHVDGHVADLTRGNPSV